MYLIYWRKLISKTTFCCLQQRFIHRIMFLILLLSKSLGNILKLQSTFTNINTLECLELRPTCFRGKYVFSLFRYFIISSTHISPESNTFHAHKGVRWFCELLQTLLTFCRFSRIELANASSGSCILDKLWCKNALRIRTMVQCHRWNLALQLKMLRLFFLLGMDVCGHLRCL